MKTNSELQKDVQDAIYWSPSLDSAEIGVTAENGIVTLTGAVNSYFKKAEAENAAKSVVGVSAVVEKLEVNFGDSWEKNDKEIAEVVLNAYDWHREIPKDKITVAIENGWVTLGGEVQWNYQKDAASNVIKYIDGVKGITSNISIKSGSSDQIGQEDIENVFKRNWHLRDEDIDIVVSGPTVMLNGFVSSPYQKDEAGRIAANAPGIEKVDNQLLVENEYELID